MTSIDQYSAPAGEQAAADSRWKDAVRGIWAALAYPDEYFRTRMELAFAIAPLLVIALLKIFLVRAQLPYVFEAILRTLPPDAAARFAHDGNSLLTGRLWVQYMGAMTMPVITVAFMAVLLYLLVVAFGAVPNYGTLFATTSYLWLIYALKAVFSFFLLTLKGLGGIRGPESLEPPVGLGLLIHHHGMLQRFADLGNLFDVWFIGAAVIALQRLTPFKKKDAISVALLWWTMLQVFRLGSAFMFQQAAG